MKNFEYDSCIHYLHIAFDSYMRILFKYFAPKRPEKSISPITATRAQNQSITFEMSIRNFTPNNSLRSKIHKSKEPRHLTFSICENSARHWKIVAAAWCHNNKCFLHFLGKNEENLRLENVIWNYDRSNARFRVLASVIDKSVGSESVNLNLKLVCCIRDTSMLIERNSHDWILFFSVKSFLYSYNTHS